MWRIFFFIFILKMATFHVFWQDSAKRPAEKKEERRKRKEEIEEKTREAKEALPLLF